VEGRERSAQEFIEGLLLGDLSSLTSSILIDRSKVDVRFEENLERFEDYLFMIEAATAAGVCFSPNLVTIRKHSEGLTSEGNLRMTAQSRLELARILEERVPEAHPFLPELRMWGHYSNGRHYQLQGEHRAAISHFQKALTEDIHYKIFGAIFISVIKSIIPG
jgi:tetratricopeptide (TPR) repeat protein